MDRPVDRDELHLRPLLRQATLYPALVMLAVAAALGWQVYALRGFAQWVDHTDVVLAEAHDLARAAVEQESALRGYLATGDRAFVESYRGAWPAVRSALDALERLVRDNPAQLRRVQHLRELDRRWREQAEAAVAAAAAADNAEAVRGRFAVMREFRAEVGRLVDVEEELRAERARRDQRAANVVLVSTVTLSILAGLVLAAMARVQLARVSQIHGRTAAAVKERAEALAESEERFRLFVEGVHDSAIYMLDTRGNVQSWNAGAERIKGYRPEEIVGKHFSILYTPEDVEAGVPARELEAAEARGQYEGEHWRVRKDGSRLWVRVTLRALRDADGRLVGYAKLVRDATERKRVEMRRAAQYGVARALSEATSLDDALPRVLQAVTAALGYELALGWVPAGEILRLRATWMRPSSRGESFIEAMRAVGVRRGEGIAGRVWATGAPAWVEDGRQDRTQPRTPHALEAGLVSSLTFGVPVGGDVDVVVQLFAGDPRARDEELVQVVTSLAIQVGTFLERQRQEAAAREAERRRALELERRVAERTVELTAVNQELEAFSYSVSHDLRAPLRALDGFSQVLLEDYAGAVDAQGRDYLGRIRAASQRMSALIDDLIQLSRVTRSELRRDDVDLSALFREVAAEVAERHPGREVEVVAPAEAHVRGDARLLRVALVNLVGNAFKFTRGRPDARVELGVTSGDGELAYYVRDNGAGFDMAYANKLFTPFQRLHTTAEFEGTGIGLATLQRIVHRHGGRVWADAAPGRGATFYFTLSDH